jgi:Tetratricopeptide repeat
MRVTSTLDLIVLLLLGTVLIMPRPDATVKPALALDPELLDRVAELQSVLAGKPDDVDAALELANLYLDGGRPDWALATVTPLSHAHPDDYRLEHVRAIAYADRFDGAPAFDAAAKATMLCERPLDTGTTTPPCGDATHSRLVLLRATLEGVAGIDMRKQPYLAKERIFKALHPAFLPRPRKP